MSKTPLTFRPNFLPFSLQLDRRVPLAIAFLFISTLAAMIISLGVGNFLFRPLKFSKHYWVLTAIVMPALSC